MGRVAIIGVGQSRFVRKYPGSIRELTFEAFKEAMTDAGMTAGDIDASVVCSAPEYDKQRSPAGIFAEYLGLNPQPTFYVETLCSSSSTGLKLAYSLVAAGLHHAVAVLGFQKMSEISSAESQERMGRGADIQWESPFGTMMPAYYALHAQAHMKKFGTRPEDLAAIRVKAATYGQINDRAVYRKPVTEEMFADPEQTMAGPVASPLRVGDCCANADGSSCLIVVSEERAKTFSKKPVWVLGVGAASASVNMTGRDDLAGLAVARQAADQAYKMAGVGPKEIDVAEVHDCFTIAEMMAYENLGFAKPGEGKELIQGKETYKEGSIPVNVDGGLLSKGHPIGATGGSQVRTIVLQLRGEAGPMQVKDPEIGLVHNIGGVGLYGNVTILGR
ncbi:MULTISPECIES: thiolase family protein [Desulfococcus]|uniref:propanoyl-CoA C-acyltransferase n=1 Tax=Desulfococcus multivorans DSM 2059 TaxID=1121405 RepID=S7VE61_DESML|nr:thiolase family protein [Desulfococcus multivorans]AOY59268.1 thiolase, C-terminal domain protein [Desulfococcus multivorans]AQV01490.1 acetyl-CoA acetyltransferase [Desulfococcus multivorans]EPR45024.1 Thiolase domain-containing protein [Desulfococcus multivorans DSM 2059]SKA26820.1 acetyl-CoA C-acetyltransferase [Desulfococcus multivorans DSM 2059]